MYIGENFRTATATSAAAEITHAHHVWLFLTAMLIIGTAMSEATTGRIPLNILMTTGESLNEEKRMAIRRMVTKDGSVAPSVAAMLPFTPRSL